MTIYAPFNDSPGKIKKEGQDISLKFVRTSDTTGRISWNIPRPSTGCDATTQAYDGIIITLDNKPANYLSTSPKDGNYYDADPTADRDLHVGSKLDNSLIQGAFYNDKKSTFLDISGLSPKTPYYVSGYAVDAQARYHREGVHAYSLPTKVGEKLEDDKSPYQDISIVSVNPIRINDLTGLVSSRDYKFAIQMCCKRYDFTIHGRNALTYSSLVDAINSAFAESVCPPKGPNPPNTGEYYLDIPNESLFQWNGKTHIEQDLIWSTRDPATPETGRYWYSSTLKKLFIYETGGWTEVANIISQKTDPTKPVSGQIWFDGTNAWEWDGSHWCELCVITSERNPLLPPLLGSNTYWYDEGASELNHWNEVIKKWDNATALYYNTDPNFLPKQTLWLNETSGKMMILKDVFEPLENVLYKELTKAGNPPKAAASLHWFIPSSGTFHTATIDDDGKYSWVIVNYLSFPTDPRDRTSCEKWWDSTNDTLNIWDSVNSRWIAVDNFYQSSTDPRMPSVLPDCSVWYNPVTNKIIKILDPSCDEADVIFSVHDPVNLPIGYIWEWEGVWKEWDGIQWNEIFPTMADDNPYSIQDGRFWYNPENKDLVRRDGGEWISITYSTIPLNPKLYDIWFNTVDNILMEWDGVNWIPSLPFAYVEFRERTCREERESLHFTTRSKGCKDCEVEFKIIVETDNLFTHLRPSVMYHDPVHGASGLVGGASYLQLGVGDDGSPDERRKLADDVRVALGWPATTIELTKEQIDFCINNALMVLRKRSSFGYDRSLFFLDLLPNQQIYKMTNECVGFNKIVDINTIYRSRGGGFKAAYAFNDAFSFAALQQMYTLGTFDILSYHLVSSYMEEIETLFAERIMFQWREKDRELRLHNTVGVRERVLIDCVIERTEQDLLTNRETAHFIQRWAIMEAKFILSQIRGKYQTLPGPNGSTTLNSQELITQAETERALLDEELSDMVMADSLSVGMRSHFVLG